jgi:hypothetical protein
MLIHPADGGNTPLHGVTHQKTVTYLIRVPWQWDFLLSEVSCIPFTLILKHRYILVGSLWERMLINASKREEENGLRRENRGWVGCATEGGLLETRNEFIKGKERRNFRLHSLREEMRFYGNSSPLLASLTPVFLWVQEWLRYSSCVTQAKSKKVKLSLWFF